MMCKLKEGMDKGGHYVVEIKGCMEKDSQTKREDG